MPIYEYHCQLCGQDSEFIQKMSDAALTLCPKCHQNGLEKKISAAAFHLKGTGWYQTDFKTDKKSDTKTTKKAEAKPASTPSSSEPKTSGSDSTNNKKKESS